MSYQLQQIGTKAIVLATITPPFDFATDIRLIQSKAAALIDPIDQAIWTIIDLTQLKMMFTELVLAIAVFGSDSEARLDLGAERLVFIGDDAMVTMATLSLKPDQYGGLVTHLFGTLVAAVAFIEGPDGSSS